MVSTLKVHVSNLDNGSTRSFLRYKYHLRFNAFGAGMKPALNIVKPTFSGGFHENYRKVNRNESLNGRSDTG